MAKSQDNRPTDAELAVLRILWDRGACTVREVHEELNRGDVRYTTTLKTMQNMADKGLVTRDKSRHSHLYSPAVAETHTQRRVVRHLLDRVFGGSAGKLVITALKSGDLSGRELQEIRKLLSKKTHRTARKRGAESGTRDDRNH